MLALRYRIDVSQPANRELEVRAVVTPERNPAAASGCWEFFLPTWTPGSYLIREFSRHLSRVDAFVAGSDTRLPCRKVAKNRVLVEAPGGESVELRYRVHAHDLTVRTADVDAGHAFWNHACVLLWPVGVRTADVTIEVAHPAGWQLACSLPAGGGSGGANVTTLSARDLDEVLDAPVLVGDLQRIEWRVDGIPHAIVLDGMAGVAPPPSLAADLERIVRQAAAVFGGPLPYRSYVFLTLATDDGHGGLEHRDSSTLLVSRTAFADPQGYREFLGLASHELFHAWNVKRMRPAELWSYDYEQENYTRLLWLVEGWTAYYDDLLVVRAGLMGEADYLAAMAKNVQAMSSSPGRFALSLEESSFDAWIRLYRPDANTRNSSQNYYGNGAVVAMCLDLTIRRRTGGSSSLDDVVRSLWTSTWEQGRGYTTEDVERAIADVAGQDCVDLLRTWVGASLDPDLEPLLADVGVKVQRSERDKPFLGIAFQGASTTVASVTSGTPAHAAGIAPGDELLAMRGLRVTGGTWQRVFAATARVGEALEVLFARRGVIVNATVTPTEAPGAIRLVIDAAAPEACSTARRAWLGGAPTN